MIWSLKDWSKVLSPDDRNDDDVSDVHMVAGFLVVPGLRIIEHTPEPEPEPKPIEEDIPQGYTSPLADAKWQRKWKANQERLAALERGFEDAIASRLAARSAVMREETAKVCNHPKGGEKALADLVEESGECFPGRAYQALARPSEASGPMRVREHRRSSDSETKYLRLAIGLHESAECPFPSWMRTFRKENRVQKDKHGHVLRDEHGTAKPGIWQAVLRNINKSAGPDVRLRKWNQACNRVFQVMGLGKNKKILEPSFIGGRVGTGLCVSLSESFHFPGTLVQPEIPAYQPNRETISLALVERFKEDAEAGKPLGWFEYKRPPKGYAGPIGRKWVPRVLRCKMTDTSLIEANARVKQENRIVSLKAAMRIAANNDNEALATKLSLKTVKAKRRLGKSNLVLWRIGDHVNGYAKQACRVLITAAAVIAGLEPGKIEYDAQKATPDERDQYERAHMLAKDGDAFCAIAVAVRHPDYMGQCRAIMAIRNALYFNPIDFS